LKSDRLTMWRFATAPKTLKSLHRNAGTPDWVVFVPRALSGADLDAAILHKGKPGQVARYETPDGDIVYMGTAQTSGRPSAMAATHSRRK
jgi:hypothetical protein